MPGDCRAGDAASAAGLMKTALDTSREMNAAAEGKDDGATVTIDIRSFRGLATLIAALANEGGRCGGEQCMGRALDGVRFWVAKDQLDAATERAARAEREAARLSAMLTNMKIYDDEAIPNWPVPEGLPTRPVSFS